MLKSFHAGTKEVSFILGPLLFVLILLFVPSGFVSEHAYKVLALAAWMITWWISEAVPMPVTALLPLVMFPYLGVMKMNQASAPYANPIIFLFMGGFLIALALEKHKLHLRIALNLIKITGTSGNGIILGFMYATAFISMWISNTATAMMMLPIATSVIKLLKNESAPESELTKAEKNFALGLMLMIGYAATIGGLATIIGTPPNVVFAGLLDDFYHIKLDFGKWMLVGVPVMIVLLFSTYFIITRILFPNRIENIKGSEELIKDQLQQLGRITTEEKRVMIVFALTSFFWIFQQSINYLLGKELLNDTNIAMSGGLLMFVIPAKNGKDKFLLTWRDTQNMAWGILILFGGGLCLAQGLESTGIIQVVGKTIAAQSNYSIWLIFILIVCSVLLSEVMSNVALVQIFVPVIFGIASGLNVNPILLAMPVTLSASIGFMFPVATPPNAIVFASGYIHVKDMMRAGFLLDAVSILIILFASTTLVEWVYG
ncbi:SLC13 family permease [Chryseosolibacter indicus]|uniref:DASS family sodium-coupled anion symporter n=1 Tax=Chryseosolibacter indicus TaxID=2782351 RepID=A0ABS5VNT6_9BACT|nr:DASS family sodium-coupled anion symporter [Chryseosolibacter indicus]MBT1702509.1 DASS family sodium-coupled anion symporter [Chryseosolibacter indicus]